MKKYTVVTVAIIAICTLETVALLTRTDGAALAGSLTAIGLVCGYIFGKTT